MTDAKFVAQLTRNAAALADDSPSAPEPENVEIDQQTEDAAIAPGGEQNPPAEPWQRQPRETALAYSYFTAWLKSGVRRPGLPPSRQAPGAWARDSAKLTYGTGANLASRWSWAARAVAYDERTSAPLAAPGDPKTLRRQLRMQAMNVAQLVLQDLQTRLAAGEHAATAGELSNLVMTIDKLTAAGEDEQQEVDRGPAPDFGKLEYKELKELQRLMRKAGGSIIVQVDTPAKGLNDAQRVQLQALMKQARPEDLPPTRS
jgi:hypothetical protein